MKQRLLQWLAVMLALCLLLPGVAVGAVESDASSGAEQEAPVEGTSAAGVALIKELEGFLPYPEWDYSQWTVGYGTGVSWSYDDYPEEYRDGITEEQAEALLFEQLVRFEGYVDGFLEDYGISVSQQQYDALVSFTFNLGNVWYVEDDTFFLRTYLIDGVENFSDELVFAAFVEWSKAGGMTLEGLVQRRCKEARMFLYGASDGGPDTFEPVVADTLPVPLTGYALSTDKATTYTAPDGMNVAGYIGSVDGPCTIWEIYENGFAKVEYPVSVGVKIAYAPLNVFIYPALPAETGVTEQNVLVYGRRDFETVLGALQAGSAYTVVGRTETAVQILYTLQETHRLGWLSLTEEPPEVELWQVNSEIGVNIRSGPGTSYDVVNSIPDKTQFTVTQKQTVDGYVWGYTPEYGGWIRLDNAVPAGGELDPPLPGDVNDDGLVNSSDARLALQFAVDAVEFTARQFEACDVNGDNLVDSSDARAILVLAVQ